MDDFNFQRLQQQFNAGQRQLQGQAHNAQHNTPERPNPVQNPYSHQLPNNVVAPQHYHQLTPAHTVQRQYNHFPPQAVLPRQLYAQQHGPSQAISSYLRGPDLRDARYAFVEPRRTLTVNGAPPLTRAFHQHDAAVSATITHRRDHMPIQNFTEAFDAAPPIIPSSTVEKRPRAESTSTTTASAAKTPTSSPPKKKRSQKTEAPVLDVNDRSGKAWTDAEEDNLVANWVGPEGAEYLAKWQEFKEEGCRLISEGPFEKTRSPTSIKSKMEEFLGIFRCYNEYLSFTGGDGDPDEEELDQEEYLDKRIERARCIGRKQVGDLKGRHIMRWTKKGWIEMFNEAFASNAAVVRSTKISSHQVSSDNEDEGRERSSDHEADAADDTHEHNALNAPTADDVNTIAPSSPRAHSPPPQPSRSPSPMLDAAQREQTPEVEIITPDATTDRAPNAPRVPIPATPVTPPAPAPADAQRARATPATQSQKARQQDVQPNAARVQDERTPAGKSRSRNNRQTTTSATATPDKKEAAGGQVKGSGTLKVKSPSGQQKRDAAKREGKKGKNAIENVSDFTSETSTFMKTLGERMGARSSLDEMREKRWAMEAEEKRMQERMKTLERLANSGDARIAEEASKKLAAMIAMMD